MSQGFRTFEQQADILIERGMHSSLGLDNGELRERIIERLRYINYYRFSAYWGMSFVSDSSKRFRPGTYWEDVVARYMFDRRLRQIIFDALSRIEIALRTHIAYRWCEEAKDDSPQKSSNNYTRSFAYKDFLSQINAYYQNSKSEEAVIYRRQCDDARKLPVWVFVEFTTFGNLQTLMNRGFKVSSLITNKVSESLGYPNDVDFFLSGIALLKDIRNACAHQSRVWNRCWRSRSGESILKESSNPAWKLRWNEACGCWEEGTEGNTLVTQRHTTAAALTYCYQIMKSIAPHSKWRERLVELLSGRDFPSKSVYREVGFSNAHWWEHPLWR